MPMIIGVVILATVLLAPRVMRLWPSVHGPRERAILGLIALGPYAIGFVVFALVWAINPTGASTGVALFGALIGLVVGAIAAGVAVFAAGRWKPAALALKP